MAPSTLPARRSTVGTWSAPDTMPLAIEGAAPMTTTNVIAFSLSPNSTSAIGNHTIDGIVCSPVTREADRGAQHLDA